MVRRHLLPPGKFETFQPINTINNITVNNINTVNNNQQQNNYQQQKQSDMARIIPKSLTINSQSHQSVSTNVSEKNLKNEGRFQKVIFQLVPVGFYIPIIYVSYIRNKKKGFFFKKKFEL